MENYEQKYKDALERARLLKLTNPDDEAIQTFVKDSFPELKESEDERIRKAILEFFKLQDDNTTYSFIPKKSILAWLENLGNMDIETYKNAEKEKYDFVSGQFIECRKSFNEFKEGNSYWFEYVGNDTYIGRSDNILNKKFHITPRQLYRLFTQEHCPKEDSVSEGTNAPTGYGKYVDECLNEAAKHFYSEGEDKYSDADLFYAGVRCGQSWMEKQRNSVKECLNLPHFTFDDVLALQCCMETVKKVQKDEKLYEALLLLHDKVHDAYHLEKQKEQKPLEYLPKEKVYDIMSKLTNLSLSYNIPIEEYKKIDEIKSNVRDLLDYPIEQKPAKWSEEDEKIRKELAEFINHYRHNNDLTSEQAEWCHTAIAWLEKQKSAETPQWMIDFLNDILSSCIIYDDYVRRQEYQSKILGTIKWLENQKAKTPQWIIDFLKEIRPYSINKEEYEGYAGRIEFESKILTIIKWLEGNTIQQKEQKPITESKRLANEVIEYLIRCGYSPVLKDDSKKEHFHIDIPRHKDDFWHSEEYKHCRSVLGEYYMEGDYGCDTYTLYIWRAKKEQKPVEGLKAERNGWYVCIKDYYCGGKKQCSVGDLVQAKGGMYIMGEEDISEWFRRAYYEEVRNAFEPNIDTNIPEKPVEWSEEDSRILYNVIAYVGYAAGQRGVRDDEFKEANAWLKSLPNGFVINPNYNEDMIKLLIAELRDAAEHNGAPRQYDAEITWLKSLRPQPHTVSIKDATKFGNLEYERGVKDGIQYAKNHHWKPSEEQMKALKIARSFVVDDFSENPTLSEILKALYEQLKKLMEE